MPLSSRNTTLLLIVLSLVILGGGGYFAYDQYNVLMKKADEVEKIEADKKVQEEKVKDLENLITEFEKIKKEALRVNEVLPTKNSVPELIYQLEAIATKESGVFFGSVSFSETAEVGAKGSKQQEEEVKGGIQKMSVTVSIAGTYEGLKRYIEAVQENIRILDVTSISLNASNASLEEGTSDIYDYTIGMMAYYVEE